MLAEVSLGNKKDSFFNQLFGYSKANFDLEWYARHANSTNSRKRLPHDFYNLAETPNVLDIHTKIFKMTYN